MPFTFSHPAAVLPVHRSFPWMSFPALFIGAMTPDTGYYFPVHDYFLRDAHTLVRSFTFCLPIGWIFVALFYFLKRPFANLIFEPHRKKILATLTNQKFDFSFFAVVSISLVFGAWTHIIWDSFTHKTGYFVQNVSVLQSVLFAIGESQYCVYNFLQHLSGVVGLVFLLLTFNRWSNLGKTRIDSLRLTIWSFVILLSLIGVFFLDPPLPFDKGYFGWRVAAFNFATTYLRILLSLLLVLLIAISLSPKVFPKIQK